MKQDDANAQNNTDEQQDVVSQQDDVSTTNVGQVQQQQLEEWKNKYYRALADYQNLERRTADVIQDARKSALEITIKKLLPAIDSLERAGKHIDDKGFHLSLKEFQKALDGLGVQKMEVVGKPFDPLSMECIQLVDPDGDTVIEELASGYAVEDKVIRVAQVKVGKSKN